MNKKAKINEDKLPPHSTEAEQGVLGCCLLSAESLGDVLERLPGAELFYEARHQLIYGELLAMTGAKVPVDLISLQQRLRDKGVLEQVGGLAYLSEVVNTVPSTANLAYYVAVVREKWLLRQLLSASAATVESVYECEEGVEEVLAAAEKRVSAITQKGIESREQEIKPLIVKAVGRIEDYHRGSAQIRGLTLGVEYVDKLIGGVGGEQNNMVVIAARPGMGKTSFALEVAMHVALDFRWWNAAAEPAGEQTGKPVAFFSLEMTAEALVNRMIFQRARADAQRWRTGFARADDFAPLTKAVDELSKGKIWIDDTPRVTIDTLKARARRLHRQHGIGLFVLDYIQLLKTGGRRFRDDRVQELAEISSELQALGKELRTPWLILAQMNRDYEKDPNRRPRLSDLKDCGAIEQDADIVGFLYTPKRAAEDDTYLAAMSRVYGDDWSAHPKRIDLLIEKHRNGPTGSCQMLFQKSCMNFMDYVGWLKQHGLKAAAAGERGSAPPERRRSQADLDIDPEDLP